MYIALIIIMFSACTFLYFKLNDFKIKELNKCLFFLTGVITHFPNPFYLLSNKFNLIKCNSTHSGVLKKNKSTTLALPYCDLIMPISITNEEYHNNTKKYIKKIKNNNPPQGGNNLQSPHIGPGLGLFTSKKSANIMGEDMLLNSFFGEGAEVNVSLNLQLLSVMKSFDKNKPIRQPHQEKNDGNIKILVVDDYEGSRYIIAKQLNNIGYKSIEANNGAQALTLWQKENQDVVITDCNMPVMSGYELSKRIRKEEKGNKTPCLIIGMTADNQNDEYNKCILSGMDACLLKPVKLNELRVTLAQFNDTSPLNLDKVRELFNSEDGEVDEEIMIFLLKSLLSSNQLDLLQLKSINTFNLGDIDTLRALTHRIKGGVALIEAHGVIAAIEIVELACKDPFSIELLYESTIKLQEKMVNLNSDIENYIISRGAV
ncbi:response regulator [Yersinia kristensenii]|uniref:response regulator n=1 Tax=Yersinia kristensenii TaxID=28152 RepID=UPI0005DD46DE|nr:response regulator [Yersinia kristensenii]CNF39437.1 two-component sensor [Yersinia kristensenii]